MKQKIITFANHKGGVSKATSTAKFSISSNILSPYLKRHKLYNIITFKLRYINML